MLFNSIEFVVFLPLVLLAYLACPRRIQNTLLLAASYVFYGWWDSRFLGLLMLSTLLDFTTARALARMVDPRPRRWLMAGYVSASLGILGTFKYFDFFVGSLAEVAALAGVELSLPTLGLVVPVGLSFYTLQGMSYVIDVCRRRTKPTGDLIAFAAYLAFFPQLVAGPIERADSFMPQFHKARVLALDRLEDGARLILWGFFKKLVIADNLALIVSAGIDHVAAGGLVLAATYGFAFQIYCDFSGYSDIARGTARLFGIELSENFRRPLLATSLPDLWRRWHVSLTGWLRDYVFLPLGGRSSLSRRIAASMVVFFLSGLWHGAAAHYVVWGLVCGVVYVPFVLSGSSRRSRPSSRARALIGWFLTFHAFALPFLLFRAPSIGAAVDAARRAVAFLSGQDGAVPINAVARVAVLGGGVLAVEWLFQGKKAHPLALEHWPAPARLALTLTVAAAIALCGNFYDVPFIYFQF